MIVLRGGFSTRLHFRERAVEAIENAVELDPHLERERPAGDVVRRNGRPAGIAKIVGMILRLEHVEHVRAERLRGLHDKRARRITSCPPPGNSAVACSTVIPFLSSALTNLVGGGEIGLIGGNDVAARIAILRVVQDVS